MLGSILITEQVETLYLFSLRAEACVWFDPNHRICGNIISIFLRTEQVTKRAEVLIPIILKATSLD